MSKRSRDRIEQVLLQYFRHHPPDGCWCSFCKNDMMLDIAYECAANSEYSWATRFHWRVIARYESSKRIKRLNGLQEAT